MSIPPCADPFEPPAAQQVVCIWAPPSLVPTLMSHPPTLAVRERPTARPPATGNPEAERCVGMMARSPLGARAELKGPVGERNVYALRRRGRIAAIAASESGLLIQIGAILATGNDAVVGAALARRALSGLPAELAHRIATVEDPLSAPALAFVLLEGDEAGTAEALRRLASRPGPIIRVQVLASARLVAGEDYNLADLVEECASATNTAAAGGNASLMTIG